MAFDASMRDLRSRFFEIYNRIQPIIAPGLRNAQFAYKETLETQLGPATRWLDIGCGRRLFPAWLPGAEQAQAALASRLNCIFGLDPDLPSLLDNHFVRHRVQGDSSSLPFANESFDLVTANMVIEHVARPEALLAEAFRVLAVRGVLLFHTPNAFSYATLLARLVPSPLKIALVGFFEGRNQEDVFPTLYRMNTPRRVRRLAATAGFSEIEVRIVESSAQSVMLGPLVFIELLWIRALRWRSFRNLRSNLIVVLRKGA